MVLAGNVCMDRYEAFVVEVDEAGHEKPHSPYEVIGRARASHAPPVKRLASGSAPPRSSPSHAAAATRRRTTIRTAGTSTRTGTAMKGRGR
jgi:hypothetical protein